MPFIDALRGIAALWVVLFHISEGRHITALQAALPTWLDVLVFRGGHLGVPIFFVLSGFVIALSIGDDHVTPAYTARFAFRRAIRLDLPYWASIAITLAFAATKAHLRPDSAAPVASVPQVLAHLVYLQDILGVRAINSVYWTLCYEVQFYLLFCVLLAIAHAVRTTSHDRRAQAVIFALAALIAIVVPVSPALHVRGLALAHWHGFLLGVFAYWTLRRGMRVRWFALFVAALLGVYIVTRDSFTMACIVTACALLLVGRAGHLTDWLRARPLQSLGTISYSLYLLHVPVTGAAFFVLGRVLQHSAWRDELGALIVIALDLAVAWVFWWRVERPSTALARRVRKR